MSLNDAQIVGSGPLIDYLATTFFYQHAFGPSGQYSVESKLINDLVVMDTS
jgi:hypothetical protein